VRHLLSKPKERRGAREVAKAERRGERSRGALGTRPTRSRFGASNGPSGAFNAC
jgi:hypothetical protein